MYAKYNKDLIDDYWYIFIDIEDKMMELFSLLFNSELRDFSLGLSSEERLHGVKYIIESFVGCIRDMVLSSGKSASDLLPIQPLIATKHENVREGCIDK